MQPLRGLLTVDLTRLLPGALASAELLRLGSRVVCVEQPGGDPMRVTAPAWDSSLRAGKESVVVDLKADPRLAGELLQRADVVLESFRPGVAARLGVGPDDASSRTVYCSITGFGVGGRHEQRAGHDLNYLGWAGALEDTAPALPPVQIADLAAGALGAVTNVLAALLERERTGRGAHVVVSMTHGSHALVAHRLGGEPVPLVLTGGLACYRIYATIDGRYLTVAALEPVFFARLCGLIGRPELAERQYDADQEALAAELADVFGRRTLVEWLELCDGEDVCVGPVATLGEAATDLCAAARAGEAPAPGEHTEAWLAELGL
jgi:crotonobetainyl-CoA:carnitine CoA-transferase CaiB-like acyl-CoA transferase